MSYRIFAALGTRVPHILHHSHVALYIMAKLFGPLHNLGLDSSTLVSSPVGTDRGRPIVPKIHTVNGYMGITLLYFRV